VKPETSNAPPLLYDWDDDDDLMTVANANDNETNDINDIIV